MDSILTADTVPLASVPDFGASREATFAHIVQPSGYFARFIFLYYAPTKKVRIKALPSGWTGGEPFKSARAALFFLFLLEQIYPNPFVWIPDPSFACFRYQEVRRFP